MLDRLQFWKKQTKLSPKQASKKELHDTARAVHTIVESGYISHGRIYRVNFIRGVFFGLGSALGATVLFAVLIYILSFFDSLPLIGGFVDVVQNTLDNRE